MRSKEGKKETQQTGHTQKEQANSSEDEEEWRGTIRCQRTEGAASSEIGA